MSEQHSENAAEAAPSARSSQWVYGREGMPVSPGIQRCSPPSRPPLSPRQEWFKNLKFGMFIHWGLESLLAGHPELAASRQPYADPRWDARSLGPELGRLGERFDPAAWVDLAERAGQRYICFTTKHHLGFANHASRHDDYTTARLAPGRDFVRLAADECHRRSMPLFAYLSLSDMHRPDFRPLDPAAWQRYEAYLFARLEELAIEYAPLAGFWLDPGPWNGPSYRYPMARIEELVRRRFPGMLVGGRDWDGAEQNYDSRVFLGEEGLVLAYDVFVAGSGPQPDAWPFEVCDTLNRSWFYNPGDADYKDVPTLIRRLVEVVGRGGNYLLDQGPLPSGALNPEDARRLEAVGEWVRRSGEALYDTRPLGAPAQPWGWPVMKKDTIYLHILRWPGERLTLSGMTKPVAAARWLHGAPLRFEAEPGGVVLHLPPAPPDEVDSVAMLRVE
jgi:alpha-L-fucosidase